MTRDDIIRMAREAGATEIGHKPMAHHFTEAQLERFFHKAQAHALANIDPSKFMSYQEGFEAGQFAEREACAKVCDELETCSDAEFFGYEFSAAIRARGQA